MNEFTACPEVYESCVIEVCPNIKNSKQNVIIHGLYRPHNASKLEFYEYISTVMQNLVNKSIMFVGDFNIDILDEVNASDFCNIMYSHHFFPLINIPTRVKENAASCLDLIWYNVSIQ